MFPRKGGITEKRGIKFSGNPDAKDYCEKKGRHLTNCDFPIDEGSIIFRENNVLDNPGRFLIDSLS